MCSAIWDAVSDERSKGGVAEAFPEVEVVSVKGKVLDGVTKLSHMTIERTTSVMIGLTREIDSSLFRTDFQSINPSLSSVYTAPS